MRVAAKLPPGAVDAVFADFQTLGDPELEKSLQQAKYFCEDMASGTAPGRWLTLLGASGTGKTMLARRIKRFFSKYLDFLPDDRNKVGEHYLRRGGFKPWIDYIGEIMSGDYSGTRNLSDDWLVVIDDIGVEYAKNRELATTKLYEILNRRIGLFTVITANIKFNEIGTRFDVRISSRLVRDGSAVVNVDTQDFNLR